MNFNNYKSVRQVLYFIPTQETDAGIMPSYYWMSEFNPNINDNWRAFQDEQTMIRNAGGRDVSEHPHHWRAYRRQVEQENAE